MSSHRRLLVPIGAALLVFAIGAAITAARSLSARELARDNLAATTDAATESVARFIETQAHIQQELGIEYLAGAFDANDLQTATDTARSRQSLVLDADGVLIGAEPIRTNLRIGDEIASGFVHFQQALAGEVGVYSSAESTTDSGSIVAVAVPFEAADGRRVFSTAFELAETSLLEQMEASLSTMGDSARFAIFNGEGGLISKTTPADAVTPEEVLGSRATSADLEAALAAGSVTRRATDGMASRLAVSRPVEGTDWRVVVSADEGDVLRTVGGDPWELSLALAAMLALLTYRTVHHRVLAKDRLRDAIERSRELEVQSRETRATLEQSPIPMAITRDGRIRSANQAFEHLTGWSIEEIRGQRIPDLLLAPEDRGAGERVYRDLDEGRSVTANLDIITRSGERRAIRKAVRPVFDTNGEVVGGIHQVADITDIRKSEEAALQLADHAGREIRGAAHDLKSPIIAMIGFADFLAEDWASLGHDTATEMANRISSAGSRALQLIDERMTTDIAAEDAEGAGVEVDLSELCDWVRSILGDTLNVEFVGPATTITSDPARLRKILLNLASNAAKYRRPGVSAFLTIAAETTEDGTRLVATDNGMGIDPTLHEKVFERGFQVDASSTGSGHGLGMVRDLVAELGGSIQIVELNGPGTVFEIELPDAQRSTSPITGSSDAMVATVSAMSESDIMIGNA